MESSKQHVTILCMCILNTDNVTGLISSFSFVYVLPYSLTPMDMQPVTLSVLDIKKKVQ